MPLQIPVYPIDYSNAMVIGDQSQSKMNMLKCDCDFTPVVQNLVVCVVSD